MKIHVNKNYFARQKTGKGKFAARLVKAWREMGVDVIEDPKTKADIALHIGRFNYPSKAKKHVLRVGPACIHIGMNWRKINHEKALSVKKADAIIYQSQYSKKIYHKLVYKPNKPEAVIFNGADQREYAKPGYSIILKNNYPYTFLASTRVWLKQKRLKQVIKLFADNEIKDGLLIICGDSQGMDKKYGKLPNALFVGPISNEMLVGYYRTCKAMIHLTFVDACPNSVIEAQVAGCPVICTDQGGTKEILRYGKVLPDKPFKYRPVNLDKPPKIDREMLIQAMREATTWNFDRKLAEDLYIENIAVQYLKFFQSIL